MNYFYYICASLVGAHATFWLRHHAKLDSIRAATLTSLVFIGLTSPFHVAVIPKLQGAFYGSCFVGMSDASKLSERDILISALLFSALFCVVSQFPISLGGSLGAAAFIACILTHYLVPRR